MRNLAGGRAFVFSEIQRPTFSNEIRPNPLRPWDINLALSLSTQTEERKRRRKEEEEEIRGTGFRDAIQNPSDHGRRLTRASINPICNFNNPAQGPDRKPEPRRAKRAREEKGDKKCTERDLNAGRLGSSRFRARDSTAGAYSAQANSAQAMGKLIWRLRS